MPENPEQRGGQICFFFRERPKIKSLIFQRLTNVRLGREKPECLEPHLIWRFEDP
jgi:hypothetical protein